MAAATQDKLIAELLERVEALELDMARYVRANGNGTGSTKRPAVVAAVPDANDMTVRPLNFVRWPKACFVCGANVAAGTSAQWVPALKSKGLACATHAEQECNLKAAELLA
jgi:hypothetical protein